MLHVVSSAGVTGTIQQALFMPLLTRMPKHRVKAQVVSLAPGFTAGAVLRQNGVPVHDVALSRKRFSAGAFGEMMKATEQFRPDVIQAWGHTAQLASLAVSSRCEWEPKVVWSAGETAPLPKTAGFIDRQKLKWLAKFSAKPDRIVYTSEASAVLHRRAGFPDGGHLVIPPGVDPVRFKPDFAGRKKVREQLGLGGDAFVIGMVAPFMPVHDHATLIKAVGELVKTNPNIALLLAGHGVQKGNGPLMALVGGGTMGTRTHLLGDWSDMSSFYNACDVACSTSQTDSSRMTLVMAMLCGIPCVGTGMGAQGEVIGQFGVAVEPGSPQAIIRGVTRVMQMPPEKRAFMAQGARKHALNNFVPVRSMQKYLQMYFDIVGRKALAADDVPAQEIDASIPPPPEGAEIIAKVKTRSKTVDNVSMTDLSDPDSIEAKVQASSVTYKKFKSDPEPEPVVAAPPAREGDVLEIFESDQANAKVSAQVVMNERARGVADEMEDLLPPEELQTGGNVALTPADAKAPEQIAAASTAPMPPKAAASAATEAPGPAAIAVQKPQPVTPVAPAVSEVSKPAVVEPPVVETKAVAPERKSEPTPEPVAEQAMPASVAMPAVKEEPNVVAAVLPAQPAEATTAVPDVAQAGSKPAESATTNAPADAWDAIDFVLPVPALPAEFAAAVAAPEAESSVAAGLVPEVPVALAASSDDEVPPQASLPFDVPAAESSAEGTFQLELLADPPPEDLKRAVGESR